MNAARLSFFDAQEEIEVCRAMAGMAEVVKCRYFVTSPKVRDSQKIFISDCFDKAFERWSTDGSCRISAVFDWRVGDATGSSAVRYVYPGRPHVGDQFIKQTMSNMMTAKIADRLYRDLTATEL